MYEGVRTEVDESAYGTTATFFRGLGTDIRTSTTFGYRSSPSSKIGADTPVLIDTRTMYSPSGTPVMSIHCPTSCLQYQSPQPDVMP